MDSGNAGWNFSASVNLAGVEPASPSRHHTNQPNWTIRAINHREGCGVLEYWPSLPCADMKFNRWVQLLLYYIPTVPWSWQWFSLWLSSLFRSADIRHAPSNHAPSPAVLLLLTQLDKTPIRVDPLVFKFCGINQAPRDKIYYILLDYTLDQ